MLHGQTHAHTPSQACTYVQVINVFETSNMETEHCPLKPDLCIGP